MKFFETSKFYSLKKSIYINLRWIAIIGQLVSVYLIYFFFNFDFDFIYSNIVIFFGVLSNIYLGRTGRRRCSPAGALSAA